MNTAGGRGNEAKSNPDGNCIRCGKVAGCGPGTLLAPNYIRSAIESDGDKIDAMAYVMN